VQVAYNTKHTVYTYIVENENTRNKKNTKNDKMTVKNTQWTNLHQQYLINKTIRNIDIDVIWSRLTNNHM